MENPHSLTGTWLQAEGGIGGLNGRRKRRQTQARSAGHRVKRQRLTGSGWGQRPGRHIFVPGEEVGRG